MSFLLKQTQVRIHTPGMLEKDAAGVHGVGGRLCVAWVESAAVCTASRMGRKRHKRFELSFHEGFVWRLAGTVKRVGRSDAYATEFDLEVEDFVPIPKGNVEKKKEVVQTVSLHDLDVANAKPQVDCTTC